MTEKEKAEAYDKAIERAKKLYGNGITEEIFPELKEDDTERIRKNCIHFLELQKQHHAATFEIEECIDWLKKQGGQKPTLPKWKYKKDNTPLLRDSIILNKYGGVAKSPSGAIVSNVWVLDYNELAKLPKEEKIEPKFKIGDWVVNKFGDSWHIDSLDKKNYQVSDGKGNYNYFPISKQDEMHLWTIQDGKDGDILACNEEILLFKSYSAQGRISLYCWYNGHTNNFHGKEVIDILLTTRNKVCPATKEQRDTLMKAMNDAGYKWDIEKKELKKKKVE